MNTNLVIFTNVKRICLCVPLLKCFGYIFYPINEISKCLDIIGKVTIVDSATTLKLDQPTMNKCDVAKLR